MTLNETRHKRHNAPKAMAAVMLLLLPLLWGCSMRGGSMYFEEPQGPDEGGEASYVTLDLRVGVNDGGSSPTRAFPPAEDGTFEASATTYEKVNTLRVVIVHKVKNEEIGMMEDIVEHNRMVAVSDTYSDIINGYYIINDNLRFKVVAGEEKQIYLFANEKAVTLSSGFDFTERLAVGKVFPKNDVENILIERTSGSPYIDNSTTATTPQYVPMSEFFEVDVPEATGAAEDSYTETLFLTRSLIKFSFSVTLAPGDSADAKTQELLKSLEGMTLRGVKISNLANSCYYLPKNTAYTPAKYSESNNPLGGRIIDQFTTPGITGADGYEGSSCTFLFPEPLPLTLAGKEADTYLYLPETKTGDGGYQLSLLFSNPDDDAFYEEVYGTKPLQFDDVITTDIPRNTHVKVNILLSTHDLSATVTLFPYTGVVLNPSFGFRDEDGR